MTGYQQQRDLGASLHLLLQDLLERERPLLAEHGLEMWDYAVLTELAAGPTRTQAELAATVGRDQTRLIPILDRLGAHGLVQRTPDPADRRNRIVALTAAGHQRLAACRGAIRSMEAGRLGALDPAARATFLATLESLAEQARARRAPPARES